MAISSRAFWPKGLPDQLRVPQAPLTHYLEVAADRYPDKAAIVYGGRSLSYGQLRARVNALSAYLSQRMGVQHGDRVLLMSQNCPQFIEAFYAVMRAGAVVVPVNAMSTAEEVAYYMHNSGAQVALVAQELLPHVLPNMQPHIANGLSAVMVHAYSDALPTEHIDPDLPEVVLTPRQPLTQAGLHGMEDAIAQQLVQTHPHPDVNDLCVLPYTSGTTGHPKGCQHTHATVLASNMSSQIWRGLHAESVFLAVAPMFHMLGMQGGMNVPITLSSTIVMMPRWHAPTAARLIEKHRVTCWAAPPAMLIDFFANPQASAWDLTSLSTLSGGGAAMPESVSALLQSRFGISYNEAYGLSETASFLLGNPPARGKRQCLGVMTPGVDARIVDPTTLEELPQGEVGEIVTAGSQLMLGYWHNDAADREAFFERDGKRFFRTGDLASIDEEGYFFMRDRLKRMINASGYKVWPAEVESAMYEHPAIHEACVVGVSDPHRGETVKVLVVLKPEARGKVTEQEIVNWSRERMAVYKAPRLVRFMDSLPKSGTGKILWRELQDAERAAT